MAKSTTGIPLLSIKAAGPRRLGGIGSAGGRALTRIKPASMPGLTGHTGGKFGVKPAAVTIAKAVKVRPTPEAPTSLPPTRTATVSRTHGDDQR
jgi:hypothetical protein